MYFDYKGWRCQLRDVKVKPKGLVVGPGGVLKPAPQFEPFVKTEVWFYHFCEGEEFKKIKGKCEGLPPHLHRKGLGGWNFRNGYMCKFCQQCGAEAPFEVLDYFAKALELWRLSAP